jgi:non-heme chloroperoxidase
MDHPERVLGLVLAGSFATLQGNPAIIDFWQSGVSQLMDPIDPDFVREFQESTLAQPIPPEFLDTIVQESLKVPAHVWRAAFEGFLEDDFVGEWDKIKAPTLIIWGARDTFCPRQEQDTLLRAIPSARLMVYENAGHALHWEEPERFAADLADFVKSLGIPSHSSPG